ncbi:hypothetical protein GUG52_16135, partial [Xanthomonas citri pv. citri]|nr:hypothetical protein [Xanthomonas citri pv. citri]
MYFIPEEITEDEYKWLANDFDAVSYEKNMEYDPDIAALFSNPSYRDRLTARQIVEAIQDASTEGMREEWEDGNSHQQPQNTKEEI